MELTAQMFLVVCPLLFLAGFVDAIGGGGGLISLPAYLLAGLPYQVAVGCNKLSATCGTVLTAARFQKNGFINIQLSIPLRYADDTTLMAESEEELKAS